MSFTRRTRVYIAGPMTQGDRVDNLSVALKAYRDLMHAGYAPLCPQLSYFAEPFVKVDHASWLDSDLPWVACADVVLRLPGESTGADKEVAHAESLGIPVVEMVGEVLAEFDPLTRGDDSSDFLDNVYREVRRARHKHPTRIHNVAEGYAIILEELEEFWDEVKRQSSARSGPAMLKELIQTAAMCCRTADDCGLLADAEESEAAA